MDEYEDIEAHKEQNTSKVPERELKEWENHNVFQHKKINDKLSGYAKKVINLAQGPLKPKMLLEFFINDVFDKPSKDILTIIKDYTTDTDSISKQLKQIVNNIKYHNEYMKKQIKLDANFILKLKQIIKAMPKKSDNEITSLKRESTISEFFNSNNTNQMPHKVGECSQQDSSTLNSIKKSKKTGKQLNVGQKTKRSRKRKLSEDSQNLNVDESNLVKRNKRLNTNGRKSNQPEPIVSINSWQCEFEEPMSIESAESQTSVDSVASSSHLTDPMSQLHLDSTSQSEMSVDSTRESTPERSLQTRSPGTSRVGGSLQETLSESNVFIDGNSKRYQPKRVNSERRRKQVKPVSKKQEKEKKRVARKRPI